MASILKHGKKWRALVARKGIRKSKTFATKREATDWAARQEYEIQNAEAVASALPLKEVFDRYAREVSTTKRGARWEQIRLAKLAKDRMARKSVSAVTATDIADWRDRRLREVAPGSVRREMVLLSSVFTQARKEWRMISASPMTDVRKPRAPERRERRPTQDEIERLALSAGDDMAHATARAFAAFLFAVETGMRAGEIVGLHGAHIDADRRVAKLPRTKNGSAREVPLSAEAVRIVQSMPEGDPVFGLRSDQLDALWRKLRNRAAVTDLHFHDSRHEAITRLSRKLDPMALARMVGHRDLSQLMTYYEADAAELATRLE